MSVFGGNDVLLKEHSCLYRRERFRARSPPLLRPIRAPAKEGRQPPAHCSPNAGHFFFCSSEKPDKAIYSGGCHFEMESLYFTTLRGDTPERVVSRRSWRAGCWRRWKHGFRLRRVIWWSPEPVAIPAGDWAGESVADAWSKSESFLEVMFHHLNSQYDFYE